MLIGAHNDAVDHQSFEISFAGQNSEHLAKNARLGEAQTLNRHYSLGKGRLKQKSGLATSPVGVFSSIR